MFVILFAFATLNPWDLGDEVAPGDLARFPADALLAAEHWSLADEHHQWVANHVQGVPWIDGHAWECETRRATLAWQHLAEAWRHREFGHSYALTWIVDDLRKLRDVIGPDDYRAGRMPDPIPYRRVMPPMGRNYPSD